jgi:hypothetical protein|tara:strand:+ start:135 stop:296 length:162 start_codon:yes stop_codon:yes gene_type:complete
MKSRVNDTGQVEYEICDGVWMTHDEIYGGSEFFKMSPKSMIWERIVSELNTYK